MKQDGYKISSILLISTLLITLAACGTVKRGSYLYEKDPDTAESATDPATLEPMMSVDSEPSDMIRERQEILKLAYNDWKGIPYLLGGSGFNGIDCSAFMQVVYEDYFSVILPRTTLEQLEFGNPVPRNSITPGDMVFFKTGRRTYHVGIMINTTDFLHASTSEGVTISELSQPYWDSTFLAFRRVLKKGY
ncbi:MAG TPA: NlpC/P60 family protein [Gracilimonas sp.]|nr:NlpC/P60 family protein [Gracilimonas sp.]